MNSANHDNPKHDQNGQKQTDKEGGQDREEDISLENSGSVEGVVKKNKQDRENEDGPVFESFDKGVERPVEFEISGPEDD